jgi:hypothetical protein
MYDVGISNNEIANVVIIMFQISYRNGIQHSRSQVPLSFLNGKDGDGM